MSPYNSWCKGEAIEVCVAVWVLSRHGNTGCTITHCRKRLVYEAHILSEVYYFTYNHNKLKAAANCVSEQGSRNCDGVLRSKCTHC